MLQSKAGYIDARPHIRQLDQSSLATHGRTIHWVRCVGAMRPTAWPDVRYASNSIRILAAQRSDVSCHFRTY
jgi:hypothetical protein